MAKDSWFKETYKGSVPNKGKKVKGEGKGKNSVNEVTTPTESVTTPPVGTSASEISRINQDTDTSDYAAGYILAAIRHTEPFRQSKEVYVAHILVDNCADENVCFPETLSGSPQAGILIWYRKTLRSGWTRSPRERTHQELTKNTLNLRSFR